MFLEHIIEIQILHRFLDQKGTSACGMTEKGHRKLCDGETACKWTGTENVASSDVECSVKNEVECRTGRFKENVVAMNVKVKDVGKVWRS